MKLSTMFTIDENSSHAVNENNMMDDKNDNRNLMKTVHHVESRTFLN